MSPESLASKFWGDWRRLAASALVLLYAMLMLIPYAVIGETWGMVWFDWTYPTSWWFKSLWEYLGAPPYVAVVTVFNAIVLLALLLVTIEARDRIDRVLRRAASGE